jgi:hypothetical protein
VKAIFAIALFFLASIGASSGVILSFEVNSPRDCGENLRVETQPSRSDKGLVSVSVTFTPNVPGSYSGRVKAFGKLVVKHKNETIAVSNLEATQKAGVFTFAFQLARDAFRDSELILSSVLYEENGLATVGGGEKCRLRLKEFQPGDPPQAEHAGGPVTPPSNSDGNGGK